MDRDRMRFLDHLDLWAALDALADRHGLTASALARKAGLNASSFNRSKRAGPDGRPRWPSTESLAKVLAATRTDLAAFARLLPGAAENTAEPSADCRPGDPSAPARASRRSHGDGEDQAMPQTALGWLLAAMVEADAKVDAPGDQPSARPLQGFAEAPWPPSGPGEAEAMGWMTSGTSAGGPQTGGSFAGLFALRVAGSALLPLYRSGDLVIGSFDCHIAAADRTLIFMRDGSLKARLFRADRGSRIIVGDPAEPHLEEEIERCDIDRLARILWASH